MKSNKTFSLNSNVVELLNSEVEFGKQSTFIEYLLLTHFVAKSRKLRNSLDTEFNAGHMDKATFETSTRQLDEINQRLSQIVSDMSSENEQIKKMRHLILRDGENE